MLRLHQLCNPPGQRKNAQRPTSNAQRSTPNIERRINPKSEIRDPQSEIKRADDGDWTCACFNFVIRPGKEKTFTFLSELHRRKRCCKY